MLFNKVVDNSDILRLEEESGASVTVRKTGTSGRILSVSVPRDERREGLGTALLRTAETVLSKQGITSLCADFSDRLEGMKEFLESRGYTVSSEIPIYSLDMKRLLTSVTLRKLMLTEPEGLSFVSLYDLTEDKKDALINTIAEMKVGLSGSDLKRFHQNASGAVFDEKGKLRAFTLSSLFESGIHADLLASMPPFDPKDVICAIQGMIKYIINDGGARNYDRLTLIACNKKVSELLRHFERKGIEGEVYGNAVFLVKDKPDTDGLDPGTELSEDEDGDAADTWRREIKKAPLQENISWKMPWSRGTASLDAASLSEPEASAGSAKETGTDAVASDESGKMPHRKPFVKISFDKYEEERRGLIMEGTKRITVDNLNEFEESLPPDLVRNMPRPFYRGLAETDGEKTGSSLVWEYKNIEEEDADNRAELLWADSSDAGLDNILREYTHEIGTEKTISSFFEFEELAPKIRQALENAGFSVREGNSRDLIMSIEELKKNPLLSKPSLPHVKCLGAIDDKQYKRGVNNSLFHKRKGLLEDIIFLPKSWFDESISSCVLEDSKVTGMLLIHEGADRRLYIDLLFSAGSEFRIDIVSMMRFSLNEAAKAYPPETQVVIRRHSAETEALANKLFPGKEGKTVLIGERREEGC